MKTKHYFATALILVLTFGVLWGQDMNEATRIKINEALDRSTVLISLKGSGDSNGIGSGFVTPDGWVLTNYHVIADPQFAGGEILVKFKDGGVYAAEVVGTDSANDLAALKLERSPGQKLTPLKLGDSDKVVAGQTVLVKGNPLGLEGTLSQGIVSAVRNLKSLTGAMIQGAIQTDAAIAQGNSGGPLVNAQGEVIGIISAGVYNPAGGSIYNNINFAIPVNRAKQLLSQVRAGGGKAVMPTPARRSSSSPDQQAQAPDNPPPTTGGSTGGQRRSSRLGGMGSGSQNSSPNLGIGSRTGTSHQTTSGSDDWLHLGISAEEYSSNKVTGLKVVEVEPNSPAARAGLRSDQDPPPNNIAKRGSFASTGHIITAADGTKVQTLDDLSSVLSDKFPGDSVTFTTVCCDDSRQEKIRVRLGWANDLAQRNRTMNRDLNRRSTSNTTMGTGVTVRIIGPDGKPYTPPKDVSLPTYPSASGADPSSGNTSRRTLPPSRNLRRLGGKEPYLGIEGEDYSENGIKGVKIMSVAAGSPAKISGLRSDKDPTPQRMSRSCRSTGHVIVSINDEKVTSTEDLDRILSRRAPGEILDVKVISCEGQLTDTLPVRLSAR